MATLKTKRVGANTYYYLGLSYRDGSNLKYKEVYAGSKMPESTEDMEKALLSKIYGEKWFAKFDGIKRAYLSRWRKMPGAVRGRKMEKLAIRFTYDTERIDESKLSYWDTEKILELGITPNGKPVRDVKEAEAYRKVFYEMLDYHGDLSVGVMLKWHRDIFGATKPDMAGQIRAHKLRVPGSKSKLSDPENIENDLMGLLRWYGRERGRMHPVELAALAHSRFERIHPFGDGNGIVGRLIMNFILYSNGYPMLNIRRAYKQGYWAALEKSNIEHDDNIFAQWFFRRYLKDNGRFATNLG